MMCPVCGAASRQVVTRELPEDQQRMVGRVCERGHSFETREVHLNMLADEREMTSALRNISRRIERYARDMRIAQDPRPTKDVAEEYGLTDARVRQIRSLFAGRAQLNNLESSLS